MKHMLSPEILKSCDIRGVYGSNLTAEDAYHIGRSFGTFLCNESLKTCAVGYDVRLSSPELSEQLVSGLRECGIDVVLLGMFPSPAVYYAVKELRLDAGVVVTASHNPAKYNGFKFLLHDRLFHGSMIEDLGRRTADGSYTTAGEPGTLVRRDLSCDYIRHLSSFLDNDNGKLLRVVWDPGNGASAAILNQFIKGLPGSHSIICGDPDGTFPCHHPDPNLPENMEMLCQEVLKAEADCGIAFDGDGDRIGVVDGKGRVLQGDQLLVIYARDFLKKNPGAIVMSEVKASSFLYEDITRNGGVPLMWKVGHTNQKDKMREKGIPLAGETSGHIFFRENHCFDDGMFAAVKLLNILSCSSTSLTEMRDSFPDMHDSGEIRLRLGEDARKKLIEDICLSLNVAGREYVDIDGVRVPCGDGFWMLRGSNTQPHITIRCEALTAEGLQLCVDEMRTEVNAAGVDFDGCRIY